ncbi:hypothetical protein AOT96_10750 [Rhodococcus sp. 008]|nr:hypothetical protein AOT96_10750 [Rhodococcus sp. 008]
MASIAALNGSSFGEQRTATFLGGGSACANAIRTVARPTWWRRANCRIEHPSIRASRRMQANNSIRVSATALQQVLASEQARCHNTEVA